jgi:type I restriction enzyme S subunit
VRVNVIDFDLDCLSRLIVPMQAYFQSASKQTTNLASINQRQLKAFRVAKPPLSEQGRIVAYLDGLQVKVDELRRLQAETQKELDALMPSVLAKAFAGEL